MYRILFLLALIVSAPQVRSQSALDVITVHGQNVSYGNVVLCVGLTCSDYFSSGEDFPFDITKLTIIRDDSDEEAPDKIPGVLSCDDESATRETQAWVLYRSVIAVRYGPGQYGMRRADRANWGDEFSFTYSDGSTAVYERADSDFFGSQGMLEIVAPNCP